MVNQQIRAKDIRLIDDEGNQMGILPLAKSLELAMGRGLDLVEVAPMANPPVCRIMDYGKYKYQQHKRAQESKKKPEDYPCQGNKITPEN